MKKIRYSDKTILEILNYLDEEKLKYSKLPEEIRIVISKKNHGKVFTKLSKILEDSKYQVQEELPEFILSVFNGSV